MLYSLIGLRRSEGFSCFKACFRLLLIVDPCHGCLYCLDDCLIFFKEKSEVAKFIKSMQKDFDLSDNGPVDKYLGVQVTRHDNG